MITRLIDRAIPPGSLVSPSARVTALLRTWVSWRIGINAGIAVFCLALIAIVWGTVIAQVRFDRRVTVDNAVRQNSNLAKAFEEHTVRTIKGIDAAVMFIAHEYARLGMKVDIAGYIKEGFVDGRLFTNLGISNVRGDMVASSQARPGPINIADREYFQVHQAQDSGSLFFSLPVQSRITGKLTFPMSRRISRPDGSFGGIVSVAVDSTYFSNFYQKTDLGEHGVVDLIGLDGISRARRAGDIRSVGVDHRATNLLQVRQNSTSGTYLTRGTVDGIPRYLSYRTLPGYPLIITVGTSQAEVLAPHLQRRQQYIRAALIVTASIILMSWLLMLATSRQRRAVDALAASEARFRATFNRAGIGICHCEPGGRLVQVNQTLCDIVGYTREELLGMTTRELSHPEDRGANDALAQRLFAGDIQRFASERRWLRKDGAVIWVNRTVSLVRDDAGKALYLIRVIEDVTARRQMQDELQKLSAECRLAEENTRLLNRELEKRVAQRTSELESANKELEAFSYSVSHDLRAPLRSILGFGKYLMEDNHDQLDAEGRVRLRRILAAGDRMGELIEDLLNLTRVSRQEMRRRHFDFSALAQRVASALTDTHPERRVQAIVQPGMTANADPRLIQIVLENLLGNAWKFTARNDAARIEIGATQLDGATIYHVRDNGAGFSMEYAHKLFAPFQRLHGHDEFEGTGIGLSIVQRIVSKHGGRIWTESASGKGAAFYFTL